MTSTGGSQSQRQIKLHSGTTYRSRTSHPKIDNMHYQANAFISGDEWLFGTTRDVEELTRGLSPRSKTLINEAPSRIMKLEEPDSQTNGALGLVFALCASLIKASLMFHWFSPYLIAFLLFIAKIICDSSREE